MPTEEEARHETGWRGFMNAKEIVRIFGDCGFKEAPTPYKYHTGTFYEWLSLMVR